MDFGVAPVVGIVVVTFLCCMPLSISGKFKDEWIPLAAGVILGGMLLVIAICKPLRKSLHRKFFF